MLNKIENVELDTFIKEYDKCFLERNLEKVQLFNPNDKSGLGYFDNHKNNNIYSVDDMLPI